MTGGPRLGIAGSEPSGEELLRVLAALANPQRLRVVAALTRGQNYVSQLARDLGMSRPLLYLHLQRLEAAGLVVGRLELSTEGKAMKYFEVAPFHLEVTPAVLARAVATLAETQATARERPQDESWEVR